MQIFHLKWHSVGNLSEFSAPKLGAFKCGPLRFILPFAFEVLCVTFNCEFLFKKYDFTLRPSTIVIGPLYLYFSIFFLHFTSVYFFACTASNVQLIKKWNKNGFNVQRGRRGDVSLFTPAMHQLALNTKIRIYAKGQLRVVRRTPNGLINVKWLDHKNWLTFDLTVWCVRLLTLRQANYMY